MKGGAYARRDYRAVRLHGAALVASMKGGAYARRDPRPLPRRGAKI